MSWHTIDGGSTTTGGRYSVSGAVGQNGGDRLPAQAEAILTQSADDIGKPGQDDFYGHGRVNAARAVSLIRE